MMSESKLTNFQRRTLSAQAKGGKALPVTCSPTSSRLKENSKNVLAQTSSKVMNGRHLAMSGKRSKDTIDCISEQTDSDVYRPLPGKLISEKDKRKLQHKMAYGVELPDVTTKNHRIPQVQEEEKVDEFDRVLQNIEERKEFLDEMEALGQGKKYRTLIQTEISQKILELEVIDKKRTEVIEAILEGT